MNGIVAAIYASFFLALCQVALKKSYKDVEPSVSFFFDTIFGLLIWVPLGFILGGKISDLPVTLIYAILSGILSEALYFYALSKGQLSITSIIVGSYPIYTIIFSYFINGERLTPMQLTFILIAIIGTLMSYLPSKLSREELKKSGAILWPIIAAVAIGFSDTMSKHVINQTSSFSFIIALALVQFPIALIYLRMEKQSPLFVLQDAKNNLSGYKFPLWGSFLNIIGTGLLWLSFNYTLASIASPITATSGAILLLFSVIFLEEKMSFRNLIGLVLVFFGVFGVSKLVG